ncbi:MAG: HI1506-related protein, partial [Desulfovibrionaceae bacterium]
MIITGKRDGFRRAGLAHPAQPTEYPDGAFSPEQLEQLLAEPMLVVILTEAEAQAGEGLIGRILAVLPELR